MTGYFQRFVFYAVISSDPKISFRLPCGLFIWLVHNSVHDPEHSVSKALPAYFLLRDGCHDTAWEHIKDKDDQIRLIGRPMHRGCPTAQIFRPHPPETKKTPAGDISVRTAQFTLPYRFSLLDGSLPSFDCEHIGKSSGRYMPV